MRRALSVFLCGLLLASSALADERDREVTERLAFIQAGLDSRAGHAERWWYGWLIGFTAVTVGQAVIALASEDRNVRADFAIGAASSALGILGMFITPVPRGRVADDLRRLPVSTPDERERALALAEQLLRRTAQGEIAANSWSEYALAGAVAVGSGVAVWYPYDLPVQGGVKIGVGLLVGSARNLTAPTGGRTAWIAYRSRYLPE